MPPPLPGQPCAVAGPFSCSVVTDGFLLPDTVLASADGAHLFISEFNGDVIRVCAHIGLYMDCAGCMGRATDVLARRMGLGCGLGAGGGGYVRGGGEEGIDIGMDGAAVSGEVGDAGGIRKEVAHVGCVGKGG